MNNLTQTKQDAKNAYLAKQQDEMLSLYEKANTEERNAILKQIDSFLSVVKQEQKIFWLKFRRRLEKLNEKQILFPLGKVFLTIGARQALEESNQNAFEFLARHQVGEWGLVCKDDANENELSVKEGFRIMSVYKTILDEKIWVITESDRSSTTILKPEEY
jgi:hypothetical protein